MYLKPSGGLISGVLLRKAFRIRNNKKIMISIMDVKILIKIYLIS